MLPNPTYVPESYRLSRHHGLSESLLSDLAAHDLEVEIQICHDERAFVSIEVVGEPGDDTMRVQRAFAIEDFITTTKLPTAAAVERTSPFVRRSMPYELLEIESVPEASGVVPVAVDADNTVEDDERPDFSRRFGAADFAAAFASAQFVSAPREEIRPSISLDNGWFTHTADNLPPVVTDDVPARSRAPLYVAVGVLGMFALGLGVAIAVLAL